MKKYGPIFGDKLNLHSSKAVKDFCAKSYPVVHLANVCKKKKPEVSIMFWREDI
jgi:hypothetical protein